MGLKEAIINEIKDCARIICENSPNNLLALLNLHNNSITPAQYQNNPRAQKEHKHLNGIPTPNVHLLYPVLDPQMLHMPSPKQPPNKIPVPAVLPFILPELHDRRPSPPGPWLQLYGRRCCGQKG